MRGGGEERRRRGGGEERRRREEERRRGGGGEEQEGATLRLFTTGMQTVGCRVVLSYTVCLLAFHKAEGMKLRREERLSHTEHAAPRPVRRQRSHASLASQSTHSHINQPCISFLKTGSLSVCHSGFRPDTCLSEADGLASAGKPDEPAENSKLCP
ncbi:hypothetical protein EYF80_038235 [Liparis tanakae]|uniref:Uncharacterized protein n=1 Tax=Liparis tanakae TaxID=230148 RepID=A0A4Z2GD95_9TELE|nr:hypothetical protein EYF80_038235 [Liparis tanakae]